MGINCDKCRKGIYSLGGAEQVGEDILCEKCAVDSESIAGVEGSVQRFACKACRLGEKLEHKLDECEKCSAFIPACALIEKLEGERQCPRCAHAYELALFTPEDHDATTCNLCKPAKR